MGHIHHWGYAIYDFSVDFFLHFLVVLNFRIEFLQTDFERSHFLFSLNLTTVILWFSYQFYLLSHMSTLGLFVIP